MVFVPSLTSFAISQVLGGGHVLLIGNVIEQDFMQGMQWECRKRPFLCPDDLCNRKYDNCKYI